jgi:hypothetical protein
MTGTNCDLFTHKSVPVIFEPPCISTQTEHSKCITKTHTHITKRMKLKQP